MEHATQAAGSLPEIRALLTRVAEIARPGDGAPKILMAIARLAGQEWLEGELRIELSGDDESTTVVVLCEYGLGIRERLFPAVRLEVPLDEFERALEISPQLVLSLTITEEAGKLVLTSLPSSSPSGAPPTFDVDLTSLGEEQRSTAPPPPDALQLIDEPPPEELRLLDIDDGWTAPSPEKQELHEGNRTHNVHTRPTVRRMVAVDVDAAFAAVEVVSKRPDPRRDDD